MSALRDNLSRSISDALGRAGAERRRRQQSPGFGARVQAVKAYQHQRFASTYADLMARDSMRAATRFFLEELYGPMDFGMRDAQFERVAPTLVKLFPGELGAIVAELAELHALSEQLDSEMGKAIDSTALNAAAYAQAWRRVGRFEDRERQIRWVVSIGICLDQQVRKPLLRSTLRLMRGPAQVAGLGSIHQFLSSGFDAFIALGGAGEFLETIAQRERTLASELSSAD